MMSRLSALDANTTHYSARAMRNTLDTTLLKAWQENGISELHRLQYGWASHRQEGKGDHLELQTQVKRTISSDTIGKAYKGIQNEEKPYTPNSFLKFQQWNDHIRSVFLQAHPDSDAFRRTARVINLLRDKLSASPNDGLHKK
jgi:hypothetical protein